MKDNKEISPDIALADWIDKRLNKNLLCDYWIYFDLIKLRDGLRSGKNWIKRKRILENIALLSTGLLLT